jgi:hypothetical protein
MPLGMPLGDQAGNPAGPRLQDRNQALNTGHRILKGLSPFCKMCHMADVPKPTSPVESTGLWSEKFNRNTMKHALALVQEAFSEEKHTLTVGVAQ